MSSNSDALVAATEGSTRPVTMQVTNAARLWSSMTFACRDRISVTKPRADAALRLIAPAPNSSGEKRALKGSISLAGLALPSRQ